MKKNALFRVDAGKVWGTSMGHIKRALLLSEHLTRKYDILFVMKDYPDGVEFVKKRGFKVRTTAIDDNSDQTLMDLCREYKIDKLLIDLHTCPYIALFEYARLEKIKTIVFDITGKFSQDADVVINDSFVKQFTAYSGLSRRTKKYLGPKFFVMENSSKPARMPKAIRNIMVTMGGSDPAGLTLKILRSMPEIFFRFNINVVLGPLFTEQKRVRKITDNLPSVKVYENPPDFLQLLSLQDIVVTAAGRTLYECAFFGKTVISVPSIEHEEKTSSEYSFLTGSIDIGAWNDRESPARLSKALNLYESDIGIRRGIFEKSRGLVDGLGIKRVLGIIR